MKKKLVVLTLLLILVVSYKQVYALTKGEAESMIEKAVQETAYAYYMRGEHIQYNTLKRSGGGGVKSMFTPEEATSQNMEYTVCSGFTTNVYYDMLKIALPPYTGNLLLYGKRYIDDGEGYKARPEVIMYANKDSNNNLIMKYKDSSGSIKTITRPTIANIYPLLKVGDVITYSGHTMLVYKLVKNSNNVTTDAIILESSFGRSNRYVYAKNMKVDNWTIGGVNKTISNLTHYLYYNEYTFDEIDEGRKEGSIDLKLLSKSYWNRINSAPYDEYTILRPLTATVDTNGNGIVILNYLSSNSDPSLVYDYKNHKVEFTDTAKDRIKFSKLYIEKTVDKHDDNAVDFGQNLTYTIKVKNNSASKYTEDLIIEEEISDLVTYKSYEVVSGSNVTFTNGTKKKWNIGKLASGAEAIIKYTVQVNKSNYGKIIESRGKVGNIPNTIVKNEINKSLSDSQKALLKAKYNDLKGTYTGRELIEEIYKQALGVTLNLSSLKIYNIDDDTASGYLFGADSDDCKGSKIEQMNCDLKLNNSHKFSSMILDKYWSGIQKYTSDSNVSTYVLRYWKGYDDDNRRADTIYKDTFQTGDILIYENHNDKDNKNNVTITKENGEYSYIYIEDVGFVGNNKGNNNSSITDDRNSYTYDYYTSNGLSVFANGNGSTTSALEFANYQALLGKDYYVILRPAQMSKLKTKSGYSIDYSNNVVYKLTSSNNISSINTLFEDNYLSLIVKNKQNSVVSDGKVYTGYKLFTKYGNNDETTYTLSVKGDTLGTGVNIDSAKNIARQVINKNTITDKGSLYAADYDGNGAVKMNDVIKIIKDVKN